MPLILDIETVPLAASMDAPYPEADRQPPANYKSDEAIGKWRAADREAWAAGRAKECSINPRLGRVLCVGMTRPQYLNAKPVEVALAKTEADERTVLEAFWAEADKAEGHVVTWNGSWDLRFLLIRSLAHGLTPSVSAFDIAAWFKKYRTAPHFDAKAVLLNWDVKVSGEGLDEWARFLGVNGKEGGLTGADVYPLYLAGEYERIVDYCAGDVAATQAIYAKIAPMFGGPA
jgi:hypothetical protein